MKTIELTTRVRVPDTVTDEQLREVNVAAAQAAVDHAVFLTGHATLVAPLQDVVMYEDRA